MNAKLPQEFDRLRKLRLHRGISLSQIARKTCISERYLAAIEAQKWDQLPGGVYRVNYVRQYAQAIDPTHGPGSVAMNLFPPEPELALDSVGRPHPERPLRAAGMVATVRRLLFGSLWAQSAQPTR